jgi:hypothetical protein
LLANIRRKNNNDEKSYIDKEVLKVNCVFTSHQLPKKQNQTKKKKSSRKEIFSGCSPQKLDLKPSRRIVLSSNEKAKKKQKFLFLLLYVQSVNNKNKKNPKSVIYFPSP